MNDMDKDKIGRVAIIGAGVAAASFLLAWGGGLEPVAAAKATALTVGGWLMGHLQRTGEVSLTTEGLKK
jgi:hypothetical protein